MSIMELFGIIKFTFDIIILFVCVVIDRIPMSWPFMFILCEPSVSILASSQVFTNTLIRAPEILEQPITLSFPMISPIALAYTSILTSLTASKIIPCSFVGRLKLFVT